MGIPTRLVQLVHPDEGRRVALVYENQLHLLATYRSVYAFAMAAVDTRWRLRDLLSTDLSGIAIDYAEVHRLETPWRFLPCFDQPEEPGRCVVSAAGRPWRYIGTGASLRGHGDPADPAGTVEIAAAYVIGPAGAPRRVGVCAGNGSRYPQLGPELTLDAEMPRVDVTVQVIRAGREIFVKRISGGEVPLQLALASIEPDHFEASDLTRPGDAHIHFFGERLFAGQSHIPAKPGDEVRIEIDGLGSALWNPVEANQQERRRVAATPL